MGFNSAFKGLIKRAMISHCPDELSNVSYTTVNNGL